MNSASSRLVTIVFVVLLLLQPVGQVYAQSARTSTPDNDPALAETILTEIGDRLESIRNAEGDPSDAPTSGVRRPDRGETSTTPTSTPSSDSPGSDGTGTSTPTANATESDPTGQTAETDSTDSADTTDGYSTTAGTDQPQQFLLQQGDTEVIVRPLSGPDPIEEFYDYYNAKAHTNNGLEESDRTLTFFWQDPQGRISLVVIHDIGDDSGGAVSFDFEGLPTSEGSWVVKDDSSDFTSETQADWAWADPKTDGGAYTGGLDGDVSITIVPAFNEQAANEPLDPGRIESWQFLSGDLSSPNRTTLDKGEPVTITAINRTPVAQFDVVTETPRNSSITQFDARRSFAPNATADDYYWEFGDGSTATGREVAHRFESPGEYDVTLTIDSPSGESVYNQTVAVENATVNGAAITNVSVTPRGPALSGFPMPKHVTVDAVGESPITEVRFTVAGETIVDSDGSDGWDLQYDTGQLNQSRTLTITAVTENGSTATESVQFGVTESPSWLTTLGDLLGWSFENGKLTIGGLFPNEPAGPIDATPPEVVPAIGGRQTEIQEAQLAFQVVYEPSKYAATVGGGSNAKGEILSKDLLTKFRASGTASANPFTLDKGNLKLQFEVEIPVYETPIGIPKVGQVLVTVNVIPSGGADATFTSRDGGLQTNASLSLGVKAGPNATVEVGPTTVEVGGLAGVSGKANILPNVSDFQGQVTGEVSAVVDALIYQQQFKFEALESLSSPLSTAEPTSTGWQVVDKRGTMPLSSTTPTGGLVAPSDASFVPGSVVDSASQQYYRITADTVRDGSPAVTTYGDGRAIVWNRQPPEKDVRAGHDLYWVNETAAGDWSEPTKITDDERYDLNPTVAGGDTAPLTVAWSRVPVNLSDSSYATPSDVYPEMEIAVKSRQSGSWGQTRLLTDDSTMDFGASVVASGDSRVVVWQRDGDANLSTTADREVWYAILGPDSVEATKLASGRDPTVAVADDGSVRVAYATTGGTDTSVVVESVSLAGTAVQQTYSTDSVSDVALSGTTVAWATQATTNESSRVQSATYANGAWSAAETVPFPNATVGVTELKLLDRPDRESAVLVFRGVDATDESQVVRYRLRADGSWLPSKPLLATEELSVVFSQIGVAGDATRFTTAAVGRNITTDEKPDLFSVSHAYVSDLDVTAGLGNDSAAVGETANVTYTVRNTGDLPVSSSFDVVVSNGSSVLDTTEVSGLAVGENRTVTVPATVDSSGTFTVRVRASNTTELTTANNVARVVAAKPDLSIGSIATARNDTNITVTANVTNPSSVDATSVNYTFTSRNATLATGQVDRLNATEDRAVSVTVPMSAVNETRSVAVTVDPSNATAESDETNNAADTRVLLPDVAVLGDTATTYNTTYGEYVSVLVENRGTGRSNVTLAISPVGGNGTAETLTDAERLGIRTVTVDGRQRTDGVAYQRVRIPLANASAGQRVEVVATTESPDLNVDNNVAVFNVTRQTRDISGDATFSFTPGEPVVGTNVSLSASTTVPAVLVESVTWDLTNDSQVDRRGTDVTASFDDKGEAVVTATVTTINGETLTETRTIDVRPTADSIVGEVDTVTVAAENASDWHSLTFETRHPDPVVLMKPASSNGSDPVHVRIRNVTPTGFEFKLEEWAYLDGGHGMERLSYVVVEAGNHTLDSGVRLVAGRTETNGSFRNVSYQTPFASNPVVLTQTQTVRERQPVVTRQQNGTSGGFAVKLDEEEAADRNHTAETVGFVAVTPSVGENYGLPFEAAHTGEYVDEYGYRITYGREYGQPPAFLASLETTTGGDTAQLRYSSLSEAGVDVTVEEEESSDYETGHNQEQVGWVLFRNSDFIYTTDAPDQPEDDEPVTAPPALPDRASPTDPDGDGKYEDVNGDGEFTVADVQSLFEALDRPEVEGYAAYDFNGDGEVNVVDVQKLFTLALE